MTAYKRPGVYIEEVSGGARPISTAGTSTACFVGNAGTKGDDETHFLGSIVDYQSKYGEEALFDTFGRAVQAFFSNGGSNAYTIRMKKGDRASFEKAFNKLKKKRDISILLLPGIVWTKDNTAADRQIITDAITHCEQTMKDRMLIVDIDEKVELNQETDVTDLALSTSSFVAYYYPWLLIANPKYEPGVSGSSVPKTFNVPPSAFVAGIWARTDSARGVWKAPAGIEASVRGIGNTIVEVGDFEQEYLNPNGINAIRALPGAGHVVWGARTAAPKPWHHVPVRRTALMIESSIRNSIQWAVFEPNTDTLWTSLRASIGGYMDTLFRAGAFQGTKASEAFFVRCGLGDTMTQTDINEGKVIVEVGFAPAKPAEFVIVKIQQIVNQAQL